VIPRRRDLVVTAFGARFCGRIFPCAIGRGGIGPKTGEGDGVTPAGVWRLTGVFYRPDRMPAPRTPLPLRRIGLFDKWSDDPRDPEYNRHVRAIASAFGHEALRRADPLYDLLATTDFNAPEPRRGAGSAIFVHVWRRPRYPTAGCVAFLARDLRAILTRWQGDSRLIIRP